MLKTTIKRILFSLFLLLAFSCKKEKETPEQFFEKGIKNAKQRKYEACVFNLSKVDELSPYSNISKQSTPVLIYCHYMQNDLEDVHQMAENYESVYPHSEELPYLYYLRGIAYFRSIKNYRKSIEPAENIIKMVKRINDIAPGSVYAENINKLVPIVIEFQDRHNLYIAQHYVKTNNFISAAGRYSNLYNQTLDEERKKIIENSMKDLLPNLGISE